MSTPYLPPQPTMERCYAFGQAVARAVTAMGLRTVILASGGMSHFPRHRPLRQSRNWSWGQQGCWRNWPRGKLKTLIGFDAVRTR